MEINTNKKISKVLWTARRTYAHIILPLRGFKHVACRRMLCTQFWALQIFTKKRHGWMDIMIYKLHWTSLGSFGPQCGYECIAMLDPQTENVFVLISSVGFQCCGAFIPFQKCLWMSLYTDIKSKKAHRRPGRGTGVHIILQLRGFVPVACDRMLCMQLQSARMNFYCRFKAVCQTKILI